jgi:hypothetical protein
MPAAIGLVDLGVLLALGVLIGLSYAYRYSMGAVVVALAQAIGSLRLPGWLGGGRVLGFAADALLKVDNAIRHALGRGVEDMQSAWNECVSYTATAVHWIGKEIASLSHDTAQAVEGLAVGQVKPWVNRRLVAALAAVAALKSRVLALERATVPRVEGITRVVTHRVTVIEHAVAVPDVGALPRVIPRVGRLEREVTDGLARLRDFARRFGPAAALATVAVAVARLGFGWVRCSKVGRVGKRLCGINEGLLDSLLADALLIAGAISIVTLARAALAAEDEIIGYVRRSVRELHDVDPVTEGGYTGVVDGRT